MGSDRARPAFVEDGDENGDAVQGTLRSASTREKPRSHRDGRSSKSRRPQVNAVSPIEQTLTTIQQVEVASREKDMKLDRRVSTSSKSPRKSTRPPSSHENRSYPKLPMPPSAANDDPSYYGIPAPTMVSPSTASQPISLVHRPRALTSQTYPRPQSYHANPSPYGPPLSMSAYFQPPMTVAPSYPPPSPSYIRYAPPLQVTQQQDYFNVQQVAPRTLASRFDSVRGAGPTLDPISRTTSAFGPRDIVSRSPPSDYDDDGYNSASEPATTRRSRRHSISRGPPMTRAEEALAMPPPPVPRQGILRRTTDYPVQAPTQDEYRISRSDYPGPTRSHRPSNNRHSVSYDHSTEDGRMIIESANSGRRRQSWYEQPESSLSSNYEAQLHQAASYQEDVAGGPTAPLTAETLRRQQKREVGSSRSTKSSASRDESDYRKSATTRTTRSGSGNDDENMTIKVTGQARVMVGGTQIDCTEGGAIEIKREKSLKTGSERSSSVYGGRRRIEEGRRPREDRPPTRSRMSSTSRRSHVRLSPQYPINTQADYF